ncbi:SRPBCC family protein [Streptomyces purpurogeneiscleroticus]|uniref:SRPBCC family protein n=1 Tax=Streptomyces purpurogeneiscleroticus TaxID=68259 RepID=UPI001CBC4CB1|nr:SRPBCC family protein [Streptomyces purpurogeneiscleroticus]MBZ4017438.1 carbon monoxide dehydrogenase [Streptomyces purpurogeneiscleroticus]
MQLTNTVSVKAPPDRVFALLNDVERVASCMPGAALGGQDGDAWQGRVTVRVGPVTAAYAGTVRFLEADAGARRLRVQARGADTHGSGDAEAEVTLVVAEAPEGALLRLDTDLVIRGKIAQFGKGAIGAVSDRILQQFAQNLGSLLDQERVPAGPSPVPAAAGFQAAPAQAAPAVPAAPELDGLSMIAGPALAKYGPVAAAFAFGLFEGWLLGRMAGLRRELKAVRRA